MNLFKYISVIPNCIPKSLQELFLSFSKNNMYTATVMDNNLEKINENIRITNVIEIPADIIQNTTIAIENLYKNILIKTYEKSIKFIEIPQLLYYAPGGKYDAHNDSEDFVNNKLQRVFERDITILVYLNDNYEGGELEMPDWGIQFKPKAGTVIAFPSYINFTHKVNPVTKGERFNIVSWICTNERIYSRPY